jgi:hypothetical protein
MVPLISGFPAVAGLCVSGRPMEAGSLSVDLQQVVARMTLTVKVTGHRRFGARLLLAKPFFFLAGWILGVGEVQVTVA